MPDTPSNVSPANGATDVSLTPTLVGSFFESDTTVTIPGPAVDPDYTVGLSMSVDGVVYGPEFYRPLGQFGRYKQRMQWRLPGGLGRYESFAGIRLRSNAPIEVSADSLWAMIE